MGKTLQKDRRKRSERRGTEMKEKYMTMEDYKILYNRITKHFKSLRQDNELLNRRVNALTKDVKKYFSIASCKYIYNNKEYTYSLMILKLIKEIEKLNDDAPRDK